MIQLSSQSHNSTFRQDWVLKLLLSYIYFSKSHLFQVIIQMALRSL